jgi:sodium transport system ATP-binding protein
MIEVENLSKRFGDVRALDGVSFGAADARITGLLGPNGAGKSTCLRILSTVIRPDGGRAAIGGIDVVAEPLAARTVVGVLPHGAGLYPQLTARENIAYYGRLHGIDKATLARRLETLIERLGLGGVADRRANGFSQGERTKVALARALVHEPRHLVLDEPTTGLDVMAARELRSWLNELKATGCCVLLSSHVMQDIAALADEILIIAHGRLVTSGTPQTLAERYANTDLEEIFIEAVESSRR